MPNIGLPELLIVLVIALIVLGPKKLPEAGRSLGRGMREFKDSISGITNTDDEDDDDDERPALGTKSTASTASTTSSAASPEKQTTS
ncbi:MAG: twin-arginine translocase TatA/TatE family subunit [Solirubrobacteraceae bacterium]